MRHNNNDGKAKTFRVTWWERAPFELSVRASTPEEAAQIVKEGNFIRSQARQLQFGSLLDSDFTVIELSADSNKNEN